MKSKLVSLLLVVMLLISHLGHVSATFPLSNPSLPESDFDFALFSGSNLDSIKINSSACNITGNVHSNSTFIYRGSNLVIDGLCQTVGDIDVKESKVNIRDRNTNAQIIEMPGLIDAAKEIVQAGDAEQYFGNKKYTGSQIELKNSIHVDGDLSFNCSSLSSEGHIMASGDVDFKPARFDSEQGILIVSENGDITLNGSTHNLVGVIYAPNGTVTINAANFVLHGRIIADNIVIRSSGCEIISSDQDLNLFDIAKLDTDKDGLPDIFEREVTGTDPKNFDTDGDGLDDSYEYLVLGTDPTKMDTDNNGILDGDEDFDGDGLTNLEEYILGTDPLKSDTDSDGLRDYDELYLFNTNPLVFDTDGDGIGDGDEIILGLDPLNKYSHAGILDSDYKVEQDLAADCFPVINKENAYELTLTINASGYVARNIIEQHSLYASCMKDNRAVLGNIMELQYDGGQVESATLKFKIDEEYISNSSGIYASTDPELEGIKRFGVFKYFEDSDMLLPIETYHDPGEGIVLADVDQLGTYCLVDLEKWFYDLGINPKEEDIAGGQALLEQSDAIPSDYTEISLEELVVAVEQMNKNSMESLTIPSSVNVPVDIVFVVDTTGSMSNAIYNVKTNIGLLVSSLYSQGITPYIAVVDYTDYRHYGEQGAFVVKKANGDVWAYDKDEAMYLVSKLVLRGGIDETPIDALEMARRLNFRNSATKFIFLVTDEGYYVNNRYGISNMAEMVELLEEDKIISSVVTKTGLKTLYQDIYLATQGAWFNIYSNFSPQIRDFIITRINDQNVFRAVLSSGLGTVILDAPLAKGGATDTDEDGLTDSQEVLWDLITIEDGQVILPLLQTCIQYQKGYGPIGPWIINILDYCRNVTVLPIKSDPTRKDSDGDGYDDPEDPRPLKSDVIVTKLSDEKLFVPIQWVETSYYYGGNQDWCRTSPKIQNGGCGTTAAANISAYFALHHEGYQELYGYDTEPITRSDFTNHIVKMADYVAPIVLYYIHVDPMYGIIIPFNLGVPSLSYFTYGVEKFASSRDVSLSGYWSSDKPNFVNGVKYVKRGLSRNSPVALITFYNPKLSEVEWTSPYGTKEIQSFNWHWVTITSITEDLISQQTTIKVSSWGGYAILDLREVIEEETICCGLMFFEP